jgi:hypothetical protein
MAHPAQRVMPNGPVGRKLQRFKCMSKVSAAYAHVREAMAEYEPLLNVSWRAAAQRGSKNNSGNWRCRMFVVRWGGARCGAKCIGLFAIQKKSDRKLHSGPSFDQKLAHEYSSSS